MILVVVEHDGAAPDRLSLEVLTLGRSLAASSGSFVASANDRPRVSASADRRSGAPDSCSTTTRIMR